MPITEGDRFGLTRWSDDADTLSREQMDQSHARLEEKGAISLEGTLALRPAAGVRGRFYFVNAGASLGNLYFDDGATWTLVGSIAGGSAISASVIDAAGDLIVGTGPDAVGRIAKGGASQIFKMNAAGSAHEYRTLEVPWLHEWAITGPINVQSGETDRILPLEILLPTGWEMVATRIRSKIHAGTSVTLRWYKNDVQQAAFSGGGDHSVTQTRQTVDGTDLALVSGDFIYPFVISATGSPQNMTVAVEGVLRLVA